ncbi:response regulator transcription factor [Mesobacillus foraminis]|uniref:response regulator transcription factor n=1 Tax=Mesobacillus foraminis TaxID=279826 RepID=UPI000EF55182|nr:response regulator [Mesobacillus foraminis]
MQLLIVDDGHYIVEYLKHLLDWEKFGIETVQTTINSVEAKEILNRNQISILITDIRMPEVSGIDLLQYINEKKLRTKVIFLSGYSDFEYSQKAIRLGAVDYLLKPVDKEDLETTMKQVVKTIDQHLLEKDLAWGEFDGLGYLLSVVCEHRFLIKDYNLYDGALKGKQFCFFQVPQISKRDEMTLRDNSSGLDAFIWSTGSNMAGIVLKSHVEVLEKNIENITISECFEFSNKNTVRHFFYKFFFQENVSTSELEMLRNCASFTKLEEGEWGYAKKDILKEYSRMISVKQKTIYLLELINFLYFTNKRLPSANVKNWIFNQLTNPDAAFQSIILDTVEIQRNERFSKGDIIDTIHTFIDDHLGEDMNLDDLGNIVYLHPVYLSKLYKQETGENLSTYISRKRLEKAAKLLRGSKLHVNDISQMVGYKKPQYFIKQFKLQYGITPHQYRREKIRQG